MPFLTFFLPLQYFILRIAEKKRVEALSKSYVKIKATDVMATTKIFYSLVYAPLLLGFYNSVFFAVIYFGIGFELTRALKWTCLFAFVFPIYLYIGIVEFDSLKSKLRIALLRFRFFFWNRDRGITRIKEIANMNFELEKEISLVIKSLSKTHLSEELKNPILNRQFSNTDIPEQKKQKVLRNIDK